MIDLIKKPTEKRNRKQFLCQKCGAQWIADQADYTTKFIDQWINNIRQYTYNGQCPCCGTDFLYGIYKENKCWRNIPEGPIENIQFLPIK